MNTRIATIYTCDYCGEEFVDKSECENHEARHNKLFDEASDAELAIELCNLREAANDYHNGNKILGMHLSSFKSLMSNAAKELRKKSANNATSNIEHEYLKTTYGGTCLAVDKRTNKLVSCSRAQELLVRG